MILRLGKNYSIIFCKFLYQKPICLLLGIIQPVYKSPENRFISMERHKTITRQDKKDTYHPLVEL
jgi:hypothetical protein